MTIKATSVKKIAALLKIYQIRVSGSNVYVKDFIGNHEWADFSPSLFDNYQRHMRSTASRLSLAKALEANKNVHFLEHIPANINTRMRTSVLVDAIFVTRKW